MDKPPVRVQRFKKKLQSGYFCNNDKSSGKTDAALLFQQKPQ